MTPRIVDAQPVAAHIHNLHARGVRLDAIAAAAGVSPCTVSKIIHGHSPRLNHRTAAAILAADPHPLDATGTRRRLQALAWAGWTYPAIGTAAGLHPVTILRIVNGQPTTHPRVAAAVQVAYDLLWDAKPPVGHGTVCARRSARTRGFLPPLAWDDDTIDDPSAAPQGVLEAPDPLTIAVRVAELLEIGCSVTEIPSRVGAEDLNQVVNAIRDPQLKAELRRRAA